MSGLLLVVVYSFLSYGPMVICDTLARNDPNRPPGYGASPSKERHAFFALRSCQQILRGETGEFFSPDYLCSNPPLWCNWTIQVPSGKRVHLLLEDFTPADTCHLKTDQIHVDEAPMTGSGVGSGASSGAGLADGSDRRILEKCWRKAEYVSLSETVHVVLLISRTANPPLRGFYGTFKALGGVPSSGSGTGEPSSDGEGGMKEDEKKEDGSEKQEPSDLRHNHSSENELPVATPRSKKTSQHASGKEDQQQSVAHSNPNAVGGHFESSMAANELPSELGHDEGQGQGQGAEKGEVKWENVRGHSEGGVPGGGGGRGRERGGGGGGGGAGGGEGKAGEVVTSDASSTKTGKKKAQRPHGDDPSSVTPAKGRMDSKVTPTGHSHRSEREDEDDDYEEAYVSVSRPPQSLASVTMTTVPRRDEERYSSTSAPVPKVQAARRPGTDANLGERASFHHTTRNGSHHLHPPGASLFEVSLEVSLSPQTGDNWDQLVQSLLPPAKKMVKEELLRYAPKAVSSKRIKRLSSGALFLLWVYFGEGRDGPETRGGFHATAEGLKGRTLLTEGGGTEGVIAYVTVSDVNECGTQLAQCDAHADCVNRMGTYACRCRQGYLDLSRSGPGGTVCIDPASTGCAWSPPALLKGVYCICFLLCLLLAMLLLGLVALYRRRHQGAFSLHCQSRCPSHVSGLAGVASPPAGSGCRGDDHRFCSCCEGSGRKGWCLSADRPLPPPPPPPPMGRCTKDGGCGKGKGKDPPLLHYGPLNETDRESRHDDGFLPILTDQ